MASPRPEQLLIYGIDRETRTSDQHTENRNEHGQYPINLRSAKQITKSQTGRNRHPQ
uniref:Uncharacterized protein n=1 Tax=Anguilla anguilla TaxID=7936 RepID=A0A0E9VK12_ANGAN